MTTRLLSVLALVLAVLPLSGETISTKCQTTNVVINAGITDLRLIGCGDGYPDNLLWHLDRLDTFDGSLDASLVRWVTGRGAIVYVADFGVQASHQEFARAEGSSVIAGIDAATPAGVPIPSCGGRDPATDPCTGENAAGLFVATHGTAVASVVGGRNAGVAPDARIVSVYVSSPTRAWDSALDLIVKHAWAPTTPPFRTAIVNISGGVAPPGSGDPPLSKIEQKIRAMIAGVDANGNPDSNGKRFFFVAAAGNLGERNSGTGFLGQCDASGGVRQYPAVLAKHIDGLISVGGMTRENERWSGACAGPLVEILAPAKDMLVASISAPDHYRGAKPEGGNSGTSYSTPYVSGIAALLLELNPELTPAELEARIKSSPSFVNEPDETGEGRVPVMPQPPARRRALRK